MNFPTKLTVTRIVLAILIMIIMVFPFDAIGIDIPVVRTSVDVSVKYIVCCILFVIASLTDFFDGYLARKHKQVTDLGKMLDSIADKILVNPVLIIFAAEGVISPIVPVIIVTRDIVVNAIKMEAASKGKVVAAISSGKVKAAALMFGIVLLFISDVPFIYMNVRVDLMLIYFATLMSLVSMVQYFGLSKKILKKNDEETI